MSKDTVSLRDVYEIMQRLEAKMDTKWDKHEARIVNLEDNQSKALGMLSIVTLFISGGLTFLWNRILGKQ